MSLSPKMFKEGFMEEVMVTMPSTGYGLDKKKEDIRLQ